MTTFEVLKTLGKRPFNLNETMSVLNPSSDIYKSWGVTSVSKLMNEYSEDTTLILKVSTNKYSSYVIITLDWDDTYTVDLVLLSGEIKQTYTDVYFDNLVEVIDSELN